MSGEAGEEMRKVTERKDEGKRKERERIKSRDGEGTGRGHRQGVSAIACY